MNLVEVEAYLQSLPEAVVLIGASLLANASSALSIKWARAALNG